MKGFHLLKGMARGCLFQRGHEFRRAAGIHGHAVFRLEYLKKACAYLAARRRREAFKEGEERRRSHFRSGRGVIHELAAKGAHREAVLLDELFHDRSEAEAPGAENIGDINEGWHAFPYRKSPGLPRKKEPAA